MALYLVQNFASGLDLRRSAETAPPGSLRVLTNAFINEGGEIEKRKAFVLDEDLTAYAQAYKGLVSGPFQVPGNPNAAFFRHRGSTLPGAPFVAGGGAVAKKVTRGAGYEQLTYWVQKSAAALTNRGPFMHGGSFSEFASKGYVVEKYLDAVTGLYRHEHINITFSSGEPVSEVVVSANAGRTFQFTLDDKGYLINGDILYASAVGDPGTMTGTGSGFLNFSAKGRPIGGALAIGDYYGQLAIFGRRAVQFYSVDPDFAQNQYQRTVTASIFAPRSAQGYGDGDVMFLGRNGVRSLQARDSSNLAQVSDVGSPIDRAIRADMIYGGLGYEPILTPEGADIPVSDYLNLSTAIVHPDNGQYWLCLGRKIYCLSRHPAAKVQAWSTYSVPVARGENENNEVGPIKSSWVGDIAAIGQTLVMRNFADEVYLYGGVTGDVYDDSRAEVVLPFMDMGNPGTNKYFNGIDLVCEGKWEIEACTANVEKGRAIPWVKVAEIDGTTRTQHRITIQGRGFQGLHIALRLTTTSPQDARVAQIGIVYEDGAKK